MRRYIGLIIWILAISFDAKGQNPLTLSEAIQLGLANNYDISIIKKNVEISENLNSQGEAGRWPSLDLSLGQGNNASEQIETASPFTPLGIIINQGVSPSLGLNWVLFEGFSVNIAKHRFEKLQMETEGNANIVVSNTIQGIIMGYYLVVLENERLEVFEKTLKLSRDRYNYVKLRKDYGTAITSDLLLEENNYLTDSVTLINQQLSYRAALRALNTLMAVQDLNQEYLLTDRIDIPAESFNISDLETRMLENNADLKTKYISQSIIKEDLKQARSGMYPRISMNVNATNSWAWLDQSNAEFYNISTETFVPGPTEILGSESRSYGVNFSLTYNLFNGMRINRAIRNAVIREDIGNIEIDKMKLSLRSDLYGSLDNFNIRKQIHNINSRKLEAAELNLSITEDKFKLGAINSFDFRTVQINSLSAAIQELNSRYSLIESKISLMRLTGTILEVYQ